MHTRTWFRAAAGILIMAALAHVSTVWPRVFALAGVLPAHSWLFVAAFALSAATALAACALAAFLAWRVPDRPDARALTFFLCFLALYWGSLFRFIQVEGANREFTIELSYGGGWVSQVAIASFLFAVAAFLRFSALFPEPLTPDRLPPSRTPRGLRRLREAFLRPVPVWSFPIALLAVQRFGTQLASLILIDKEAVAASGQAPRSFIVTLIGIACIQVVACLCALLLGARNLRDSYRRVSAADRKRMMWVVGGFSASTWMVFGALGLVALIVATDISADALGAAIPLALVFAPAILVASAAIGILYAGAIDPALVLRRSTVYGIVGALGLVMFAAIENVLSELVEQRLHMPGFVGAILAGGLVTIGLIPVRSGIASMIKRRSGSPSGSILPDADARTADASVGPPAAATPPADS
jgi:hypothetical protein